MRYAIGVGSNLGDRAGHIARAASLLCADGMVQMVAQAPPYENPAVGGPPGQGPFLNGAWVVRSALGPHQLLARLQSIESRLGRVRTVPWGPRTIDLDLLLADTPLVITSAVLNLPHPLIAERPFVLVPLIAVAGDWRHPLLGCRIGDLL